MDNYIIAKATSVGQVRQVNEDSMTVFSSRNGQVMAVCDGMGGQAAGDVASQLAVSIIESILTDNDFDTPEEAIRRSVLAANQGVLNRQAQNPELGGMGSTCVMLIIRNGKVYGGWVGDSRIYYIANHSIRQLSHDQSYVQDMVDRGEITQDEAQNHPQKNEITNAIGLQGMTAPTTFPNPIQPEPGSVFLLCSDGLTTMVDDARIERVISKTGMTLQEKADSLVAMANEAGGLDNITVELIQFGSASNATTMPNPTAAPAKGKGKSRLWAIVAACILLIAALAVGAYFIFGGKEEPVKKELKHEKQKGGTHQSAGSEKPQEKPQAAPASAPPAAPASKPKGRTTSTPKVQDRPTKKQIEKAVPPNPEPTLLPEPDTKTKEEIENKFN